MQKLFQYLLCKQTASARCLISELLQWPCLIVKVSPFRIHADNKRHFYDFKPTYSLCAKLRKRNNFRRCYTLCQ